MVKNLIALLGALGVELLELAGIAMVVVGLLMLAGAGWAVVAVGVALLLKSWEVDARRSDRERR